MVKDIIREIKRKWFQFFAIVIITALGVGFFIGIQVTGYDMRETADLYMETNEALDLEFRHTLGIDDEMIKELNKNIDGNVYGVYDDDAYLKNGVIDDVVKVIEYDENTQNDLRLIDGDLPKENKEVAVDSVMKDLYDLKIGDTLEISKAEIFEKQEIVISGFVESSLFMNLERGQSRLGSGNVAGFIYPTKLDHKDDVFTSARIVLNDDTNVSSVKEKIEKLEPELVDGRFNRLVEPERKKIEDAQAELEIEKDKANAEFADAEKTIKNNELLLQDTHEELESGLIEIMGVLPDKPLEDQWQSAKRYLSEQKTMAKQEIKKSYAIIDEMPDGKEKEAALKEVQNEEIEVDSNLAMADQGLIEIKKGIEEYNKGVVELQQAKKELKNEKNIAFSELDSAQNEIDEALIEINEANRGKGYLFDREDTIIGYREFYQDSDRIEAIGKVFPLIFFGVAILVTLSTVSRMIDESRMQIGVYKALGYSSFSSAMKYVGFTLLAWLIGSVFGLIIGFYLVPSLIYNAYRIMYKTPELEDGIVLSYAILPILISFVSSVGIAFGKSISVSREKGALLLRPEMPKGGQRIFLEKIKFIWERLSFLYKVSLRNLFRNKTRFLMTVAGIGGSFGLLITGFGLRHSIHSIVDIQFGELIRYDGIVTYEDGADLDESIFDDSVNIYSAAIDIEKEDVTLYVSDDMDKLSEFTIFQDRKSSDSIEATQDKVIVSEKLADITNVSVGDSLTYSQNDRDYEFTVGEIVENYVYHYIYMPKEVHQKITNQDKLPNTALFKSDTSNESLNKELYKNEDVLAINHLKDIKSTYLDMMGSFDIVIVVIVGAAFALELIVLLNLITMNLSERYKEMATLKVLGFYPKELAQYLLRENILLTFISLIFGGIFGKFLHQFVIVNAETAGIMFNRELLASSYLLAAALTLSLSIIINVLMARRANNVNMSEALKTHDA